MTPADGRPTFLEVSDKYDPITGVVPASLRSDISRGHVTADKYIAGRDLAKLVPAGRFVLHEQPDGLHLIEGEMTNA
ncbi:MAG: hypothetical protein PIR02_15875 [Microbacterium enclense]